MSVRDFVFWPVKIQALVAIAICLSTAVAARLWFLNLQQTNLQIQLDIDRAQVLPLNSPQETLPSTFSPPSVFILERSLREQSIDDVIHQAVDVALSEGITIRSLSVSHQLPSPSAQGRVVLEISTTGTYADSKTWQSVLSERFPALAVKSLRMQAAPASNLGLDAQWVWVLHARD